MAVHHYIATPEETLSVYICLPGIPDVVVHIMRRSRGLLILGEVQWKKKRAIRAPWIQSRTGLIPSYELPSVASPVGPGSSYNVDLYSMCGRRKYVPVDWRVPRCGSTCRIR